MVANQRHHHRKACLTRTVTAWSRQLPSPEAQRRAFPIVAPFRFAPGVRWAGYLGIFYHLAIFLLVFKLPAPEWARAAGYGWLLLDVAAGTLGINQVQPAIAQDVRLGGHIFAGIWIVMASLQQSLAVKLVGLPTGAILFAYTFASPFLPRVWLSPAAILMLVWLAILAWQNGIRPL